MALTEIATQIKVLALQRTLGRKAKENSRWRAWSLYGDLCRRDVLETALAAVLRKAGSAGVDGMTTDQVKTWSAAFLDELQSQLRDKSYRPSPVLRVWIPKADGKKRPLGIPTVKDRVVQTALLLLLTPIFEADFNEGSFGYRPGRNAHQALDAICQALLQGHHEVIDVDLQGYFDLVPHAGLLRLVARRVSDGSVLRLIKLFLKAPIQEAVDGKKVVRPNLCGTPQGGVISPLLANLYLNSLDHGVNGNPELGTKLVRYADDLVLLCRPGRSPATYERLKIYLARKELKLNESKSRCLDARQESFHFLGFRVGWRRSGFTAGHYTHVEPGHKARVRFREAIRSELNHWTRWRSSVETVRRVNRIVQGWSNYYHYGACSKVFGGLQFWVRQRYQKWLWEKFGRKHGRRTFFTDDRLHGLYNLWKMPTTAGWRR